MVHPPQGPLPGRAPGTPFQRNRLYLSIHLSIHPSICLYIYLSIYLSLFIYLSIDLSIYLSRTYPSEQKVVATSPGDPIISGYGQDHFMAKIMVSGYVLGHKTIEYIGT